MSKQAMNSAIPGFKSLPHVGCIIALVTQWQRSYLPMQETGVQFLGQEDPLEKDMATHSSILG